MKNLFYKIYNCDSYAALYKLVHSDPLLSDPANWRPYGGILNNSGTFGGQQSLAEAALVEKLTNSIDAILTKECLIRGIDPKSHSPKVPQTMTEAIERFFNVIKGKWENADKRRRREIAEKLQIIVSNDYKTPNVVIYDEGEGQTPQSFPETFLSLLHDNKINIPFVQGKFNMGSTGAVLFCGGDEKYQLIISRRAKGLCSAEEYKYGFTLVRKHPLSSDEEFTMKSIWYEYFAPAGEIPSFGAEALDLGLHNRLFVDGTVIKLYSYELNARSTAVIELWRELNSLFYEPSLPMLICERRKFEGKTNEAVMLGNKTRISIDDRENVYKSWSCSIRDIANFGAEIPVEVIIFKTEKAGKEFIKRRSVIFTVNGQTQGFEGWPFISIDLGIKPLRDCMLVCVDCSKIKNSVRYDLFMTSRDRMREGNKYAILKQHLIDLLKNDERLKQLNQEYKGKKLIESKNDKEMIQHFFDKLANNTNIKKLLTNIKGLYSYSSKRIEQTYESGASKKKVETPKLDRFPSYIRVTNLKEKDGKLYKAIALDGHGTITFETNAEDEFLTRNIERGNLEITIMDYGNHGYGGTGELLPTSPDDKLTISRSGPNDGEIRLSITPTEKAVAGDMFEISAKMISVAGEVEAVVFVGIEDKKEKKENSVKTTETPNLNLPQAIRVFKEKTSDDSAAWEECVPPMTANDVIQLKIDGDNISQIRINMDSNLLKRQINKRGVSVAMVGNKYFTTIYSHALILYSTLSGYYNGQNEDLGLEKRELDIIRDDLGKAIATIFQYYGGFLMDIGDMDLTDE